MILIIEHMPLFSEDGKTVQWNLTQEIILKFLRLISSWALGFICFVMSISVLPETKKTYSSKTNSIIPFGTFFKFQSIVHMIEARGIWHACQLPQLHDKVALRFIIQQQPMCNIKVSCWVFQSTLYHMVQL